MRPISQDINDIGVSQAKAEGKNVIAEGTAVQRPGDK